MLFNDFADVILYAIAWCGSTNWNFALFGKEWSFPILQLMLIPVYASIGIFIIRKVLEGTKD